LTEGQPKTAKSRRRIELPSIAVEALKAHRANTFSQRLKDGWGFCDSDGGALRRSNFRKRSFLPLLAKSSLPLIRFHDLRHTAATLLLSQEVHPKVVQERLGHAQVSTTLDTYSHVRPSLQKEAASKLDSIFGSKVKQHLSSTLGKLRGQESAFNQEKPHEDCN
jgi:integrase